MITRAVEPQTAAATLARKLRGVPTPWMTTGWMETPHNASPVQIVVRFRLWVRRRGNTLHIETHRESPNYAGLIKAIQPNQRQGLYAMYVSGMELVRMSTSDPTMPPANPRYLWNKDDRGWLNAKEHVTVVASHLHVFFNPRRGRPRKDGRQLVVGDPVLPGRPIGMRNARRKEYLATTQKLLDVIEPALDRAHDQRRMRCYTPEQRSEIQGLLNQVHRATRQLRHLVYTDKFGAMGEKDESAGHTDAAAVTLAPSGPNSLAADELPDL